MKAMGLYVSRLWIDNRPGSITLMPPMEALDHGCGLTTGRDQLHFWLSCYSPLIGCGLTTGRDQLHWGIQIRPQSDSCGLTTGRDQLHYISFPSLLITLWIDNRPGSITLIKRLGARIWELWIDNRPGSITLYGNSERNVRRCGLTTGRDQLHYKAREALR